MALKDVIIGYAKGDKGDKGDIGERGATGQTGPQGEPGNIADAAITDTQGLDVAKGAKTTAQKLFDAIADRIVNKLVTNDTLTTKLADYLLKSAMSSTNINSTTNVPTSALVYSLMQDVNNNLSDGLYGTVQDTTLDQLMKHMSDWNHPFVFDISYTLPIAPDTNNAVGIGERGMLHAFSYSGKHFYCIDASKGWQESPYALKSDLWPQNPGTKITANTDMYTITTPGHYYCGENATAASLKNCPCTEAFTLTVYRGAGGPIDGMYTIQEYTSYTGNIRITQTYNMDSKKWTVHKFAFSS